MAAHDHLPADDVRVDFGNRLFITAFFVPLALGSVLSIVGFGQTNNSGIALLGLVNLVLLIFLANRLYTGDRQFELVVRIVGGVSVLAGVLTLLLASRGPVKFHLTVQLLVPALFAAMMALGPVRIFLRCRRGEVVEAPAEAAAWESLWSRDDTGPGVAVRADAKPAILRHALVLRIAGALLLICAVAGLALAALALVRHGTGLSLALAALLPIPAALVIFALADSWRFLASTHGPEKAHLANVIRDMSIVLNCVLTAATLLGLLCVLELATR